jgi:hypothetical protein
LPDKRKSIMNATAAMTVHIKSDNITTDKVCETVNKMESCDGYIIIIIIIIIIIYGKL